MASDSRPLGKCPLECNTNFLGDPMLEIFKNGIFSALPARSRFRRIYRQNQWGSEESTSGEGSTLAYTEKLRCELGSVLDKYEVESLVDVACGDFNWMRVFLKEHPITYLGVDIVPDLIAANKDKYESETIQFQELNVVDSVPPKGDVILFRDCILHLSFNDAIRALRNIVESEAPLILVSSYPEEENSNDIISGRWRRVNLREPPFDLPEPMCIIDENAPGKVLALWKRNDLLHL